MNKLKEMDISIENVKWYWDLIDTEDFLWEDLLVRKKQNIHKIQKTSRIPERFKKYLG